jgi:hypothetical protein
LYALGYIVWQMGTIIGPASGGHSASILPPCRISSAGLLVVQPIMTIRPARAVKEGAAGPPNPADNLPICNRTTVFAGLHHA